MRAVTTAVVGLALALSVASCSAPVGEGSVAPDEEPQGAATIEEVWAEIGCEENDPMGTRGIIDLTPPEAPVVHHGSCRPLDGGELAFFWELPSPEAASEWLASGELEIGATDAVFLDGAVVILASDAATAQEFGSKFEPYE